MEALQTGAPDHIVAALNDFTPRQRVSVMLSLKTNRKGGVNAAHFKVGSASQIACARAMLGKPTLAHSLRRSLFGANKLAMTNETMSTVSVR